MKLTLRSCRFFMHVSMFVLLLVCLWALREVLRSHDLQQAVATRSDTRAALGRLEAEAQQLEQLSSRWAVSGAMSFEIRQTITSALRDAVFPDPVVIGSHRLHKASLSLPRLPAEDAFATLAAIQGLPVRVQQMDVAVDDRGRVNGAIEVAWLERL